MHGESARSSVARARPRLRLRLRTVLLTLSLSVLVLPVASLQLLRIYESVLIRQTEGSLVAQSAFTVAIYRSAFAREVGRVDAGSGSAAGDGQPPQAATLDLAVSELLPPFAPARLAERADPVALRVGTTLGNVLRDAANATGATLRIFDANGVVIATTADDAGLSLAHNVEVGVALTGRSTSRLRRVAVEPAPIAAISRNTAIRVHVASPIVVDGRLVGGVLVSRSPSTILGALSGKYWLLAQAATLVAAVVVGIALVAARTLVLPIRRLRRAAGRLASQETDRFDGGRPYRVIELAELAASVQAMAESLQERARYVRDFARHVNHEFKTPIAAMRGAVELLREHIDTMSRDETRGFLANLDVDIERLERLTLRLLELADADMARPSDEVIDVAEVAKALGRPELRVAPACRRLPSAWPGPRWRPSFNTSSTTRSRAVPRRWSCARRSSATAYWSMSRTMDRVCLPGIGRASSSRSSRPAAMPAAPDWGCRSAVRWSAMPAATSNCRRRTRARRSGSHCRPNRCASASVARGEHGSPRPGESAAPRSPRAADTPRCRRAIRDHPP